MKTNRFASATLPFALAATLLAGGCSKKAPPQQATNQPEQYPQQQQPMQPAPNNMQAQPAQQMPPPPPNEQQAAPPRNGNNGNGYANSAPAPAPAPAPVPVSFTIPAGTHIRVTTAQELGSKISQSGESFSATVADPVVVRGVTLIRAGAPATGTVIDAKSLGRFKGAAELGLRLDSVRAAGRTYQISSSSIDRVEKGKGKRTAVMAGGGGGLGAIIGGLAGGGKGALIGGLLGAGAGTAGTAFTGNKEIVIPAETNLTFRLEHSVTVTR